MYINPKIILKRSVHINTAKKLERVSTPQSLHMEHEELHEQLKQAIDELLHPHFEKEEKYAVPPLELLTFLTEQRETKMTPNDMHYQNTIITLTDKLKEDLPNMLDEHKKIVSALENLIDAAIQENKPEHKHFAEKLRLHAQTEEEILYPAAILVGEYLKLKSSH
jgi:hypothetical protein